MNFHGVETKEGWHLGKATETVGINCYFTESRITREMGLWACLWESISIVLAEVGKQSELPFTLGKAVPWLYPALLRGVGS